MGRGFGVRAYNAKYSGEPKSPPHPPHPPPRPLQGGAHGGRVRGGWCDATNRNGLRLCHPWGPEGVPPPPGAPPRSGCARTSAGPSSGSRLRHSAVLLPPHALTAERRSVRSVWASRSAGAPGPAAWWLRVRGPGWSPRGARAPRPASARVGRLGLGGRWGAAGQHTH